MCFVGIFAHHLNGEDLARAVMVVLSGRYRLLFEWLMFGCRDGAAVNGVAMDRMSFFAPNLIDLICWSHSLAVMGKEFNKNFKLSFRVMRLWSHLLSRSSGASSCWRARSSSSCACPACP